MKHSRENFDVSKDEMQDIARGIDASEIEDELIKDMEKENEESIVEDERDHQDESSRPARERVRK